MESDQEDYDLKARSFIYLCLTDDVLYNILNEDYATKFWLNLEILYMVKFLTNISTSSRNSICYKCEKV